MRLLKFTYYLIRAALYSLYFSLLCCKKLNLQYCITEKAIGEEGRETKLGELSEEVAFLRKIRYHQQLNDNCKLYV